MHRYLIPSLILLAVCLVFVIPQASALPVSYNQTALNFGLTSVPRNSSSYDIFPLIPDNWLWEKFDNNTIDSGALSVAGTITYNTNLKALYKFENNIIDSTTNARTLTKGAGTQTFVSGHEGQGISLDGSTYYTASDAGMSSGTGSWSFETFIYRSSSPGAIQTIFSYGSTNANQAALLSLDATYHLNYNNYGNGLNVVSSGTIPLNTWTQVAVTYDGTTIRLYINGAADGSGAYVLGTVLNALNIGQELGNIQRFTGNIDESRYYTSTLTLAQIQALNMGGHYSQSHTFDGGEYVTASDGDMPLGNSAWTVSGWIKPYVTTSYFFGWGTNAGTNLMSLFLDNTNHLSIEDATTILGASTGTITLSTYNYVAVTYDGSTITYYINGLSSGTTSVSARNIVSSGASGIKIGIHPNLSVPMTAQLDNLKVYPYALSSSQITSDYNSISPISSGKQYMSWYHGVSGSPTLSNKLGPGQATLTLNGNLGVLTANIVSNNTNIYYSYGAAPVANVNHIDLITGTNTHDYSGADGTSGTTQRALFMGIRHIFAGASDGINPMNLDSEKGNLTTAVIGSLTVSDQKILLNGGSGAGIKFNQNTTAVQTVSTNQCEINYNPTNTTKQIDNIACDKSVPAMAIKYWNGMNIQKIAGYSTNNTQTFLNSVDASTYKKLLSLPCNILVNETPCITFILTDTTQTDYLIVLTSTHVYYGKAQTALHLLQNNNYALQSYDVITQATTSAFEIPNPILQSMTLYGFNLNNTISKTGLFTLPSGYSARTTTVSPSIRLIDPRWSNDLTDMPIITSTSSLFPIFLTASNAPSFSAIKVTSAQQIINNQEAVWAVVQLDSTRSVEFDLPPGICANVYIADISVSPTVWNFEGIICATGVNQKTIAYVNTVPFTFYTLKYGVTDSYVPSNNGLQTTFRTQAAPTTYTVIVRNSTGTVAINQTFTIPANQTVDTRTFNVSSVSKPAALSVSVGGNLVYSAYLGSTLSLATVSSFFHQYFSYQGFDLLSMIPVVLASAFTRNTIGAGMVIVVLAIATLSWLSVTVVPEPVVYISIFISVLGIIGYRSAYG